MSLSQNRGRDGHTENALQKLWLIGGTASRTAQKRGETSPTPSSVRKAWRNKAHNNPTEINKPLSGFARHLQYGKEGPQTIFCQGKHVSEVSLGRWRGKRLEEGTLGCAWRSKLCSCKPSLWLWWKLQGTRVTELCASSLLLSNFRKNSLKLLFLCVCVWLFWAYYSVMNNYGEAVRRCAQKSIFRDFFTTEAWMYFVAELDPLFTSYKFYVPF